MAVLGVAPDLFIKGKKYEPSTEKYDSLARSVEASTPWINAKSTLSATALQVQLPSVPPDVTGAFILSVGVRFGVPDGEGVAQTRHAGCARILSVVSFGAQTALSDPATQ